PRTRRGAGAGRPGPGTGGRVAFVGSRGWSGELASGTTGACGPCGWGGRRRRARGYLVRISLSLRVWRRRYTSLPWRIRTSRWPWSRRALSSSSPGSVAWPRAGGVGSGVPSKADGWEREASIARTPRSTGAVNANDSHLTVNRSACGHRLGAPPGRLLQAGGQLQRAQVLQQLRDAAGTEDHRGHVRIAQAPGDRERRGAHAQLAGQRGEARGARPQARALAALQALAQPRLAVGARALRDAVCVLA